MFDRHDHAACKYYPYEKSQYHKGADNNDRHAVNGLLCRKGCCCGAADDYAPACALDRCVGVEAFLSAGIDLDPRAAFASQ